jgi:hypothetical protein
MLVLQVFNDIWYIYVVITAVSSTTPRPVWEKRLWYMIEGAISVTVGIMVLTTLAKLKRVIMLNPAVKVPSAILVTNTLVILCLIFFNFWVSDPNVNFMDVGNNVVAIIIQMLLIGFCWQNSLQPKK